MFRLKMRQTSKIFLVFYGMFQSAFVEGEDREPFHCHFLGIEINTVDMVFCLPLDKLLQIMTLIDTFLMSKKVQLKGL